MKIFMRILNAVLTIGCAILIGLFLWLVYLVLAKGYGGAEAIAYIAAMVDSWAAALGL